MNIIFIFVFFNAAAEKKYDTRCLEMHIKQLDFLKLFQKKEYFRPLSFQGVVLKCIEHTNFAATAVFSLS